MRQMILRTAFAIVRFWTRLYTSGLPEALREARREEYRPQFVPHGDDLFAGQANAEAKP